MPTEAQKLFRTHDRTCDLIYHASQVAHTKTYELNEIFFFFEDDSAFSLDRDTWGGMTFIKLTYNDYVLLY